MTDLEPCPFCGGKPIVFADSVACLDCGVRYYGLLSKSKAVEAWNTRIVSTPTPSKTAVELAEVIDEHAYYLTATQIRDALHESVEKIGAMPAASSNKVVDIVDHRLSEKEEED